MLKNEGNKLLFFCDSYTIRMETKTQTFSIYTVQQFYSIIMFSICSSIIDATYSSSVDLTLLLFMVVTLYCASTGITLQIQ